MLKPFVTLCALLAAGFLRAENFPPPLSADSARAEPLSVPPALSAERLELNSDDERKPYQKPLRLVARTQDSVTVKNVRSGMETGTLNWGAYTLKPALVKDAYFVHRANNITHALVYFTFKSGGMASASGGRAGGGIAFSAEPYLHRDDKYANVILYRHKLILVVSTWDDYLAQQAKRRYTLRAYRLTLSRARLKALLETAVTRALRPMTGDYEILTNNCTTNPVDLLNAVLPPEQQVPTHTLFGMMDTPGHMMPAKAVAALKERGVIKAEPQVYNPQFAGRLAPPEGDLLDYGF